MSFRELRNFTETMRALGYRRNVSVEDFRTPNFALVADCLFWLVRRFDPHFELSDDISTEDARVEFIQTVAQFFLSKTRQKLSVKQLYRADGYAVKELLKISTMLYEAVRLQSRQADDDNSGPDPTLSTKLEELRQTRPLAGEIVQSGSNLFDLLAQEEEMRAAREKAMRFLDAMSTNLESKDPQVAIERAIRQQINIVEDNLGSLQKSCAALEEDRTALLGKVERKRAEQERLEKRLKGLKQVRPAYMEEYEALENELKVVYEQYVERTRNLSALERQLDEVHRSEQSKQLQHDRALKRMQKRLREEELRILRGEQDVDESRIDDSVFDSEKESTAEEDEEDNRGARKPVRPAGANNRNRRLSDNPDDEEGDGDVAMHNAEEDGSENRDEDAEEEDEDEDDDDEEEQSDDGDEEDPDGADRGPRAPSEDDDDF